MKKSLIIISILLLVGLGFYFLLPKNDKKADELNQTERTALGGLDAYGTPVSKYEIKENITYYDNVIFEADPSSLEIIKGSLVVMIDYIEYYYAKDKNNVYYQGKKLVNADLKNFSLIENGEGIHNFGTDAKTIYFGEKIIKGADPNTFKILWTNMYEGCGYSHYEKDSKQVYLEANIVPNADVNTFEALINGYGKDKNGYFKGTEFIGKSLNPEELVCKYG